MQKRIVEQLSETQQMISTMLADSTLIDTVTACSLRCIECLKSGGKILLVGNGGSAADAQHFAAELVGRLAFDRAGLPAIALTTDTSILTAVGNDYGYERIFARQIQALGAEGDVLICYSTSGQSANILLALEEAKTKAMVSIGMTGNRRGAMLELCDYLLEVPSYKTSNIQEGHSVLGHIICHMIEGMFFKQKT